jgi:hypothetical protein
VLLLRHVDHHEALVHVDLAGGEADAGRGIHGLEHVIDQALECRRGNSCRVNRPGHGAQAWIGEFEDGQLGHA